MDFLSLSGAIAGDEQIRITPSLKDQKGDFYFVLYWLFFIKGGG